MNGGEQSHMRSLTRLLQMERVIDLTSLCGFLLPTCWVHLENELAGNLPLDQISDLRFTKTGCRLGRLIHACVCYSAFPM